MNRPLPFKGFYANRDGSVLKRYWTAPKDCKVCPMKSQCAPNSKCKKITRTAYDEQYLRAYGRQHSEKGKQMKKRRQSTVEPVFGSPAQFYGLRKIGVLGKAGAHKVMLIAAIAFNLKYLKKGGRKPLHWHFQDDYGCLPRLPGHYLPTDPIKTGSSEGSVKKAYSCRFLVRAPLLQQPRTFFGTHTDFFFNSV